MGNFDQKEQNVNNQINVAGDVSLGRKSGTIWITAGGKERYFSSQVKPNMYSSVWMQLLEAGRYLMVTSRLDEGYDFDIIIDGSYVIDGINPGETKKFNLKPGKYTIEVKPNLTEARKAAGAGLAELIRESLLRNESKLTFPIEAGETIELIYEDFKLSFKK